MQSRIILGVGILGLMGCGVFGSADDSTPAAAAPAPDPGTTTEDGGLPEGAPPPAVGTPQDAELTDAFGVFVTATAAAGGDGTKMHPFATIAAGIDRVKDLKLRVYVCAGTYAESLTLVNAVSVIGSLACDGGMWKSGGGRSIIEAPTSPAIRAKDIALATRFEGFDVTAPAGTAMSPNSIALIAENATMLTIAKSKLTSAKAFDGADGTDGAQLALGATAKGHDGIPFDGTELLPNPVTGPVQHVGQAAGVGSCVGVANHDGLTGTKGGDADTLVCNKHYVPPVFPATVGTTYWAWEVYSNQVRSNALPSAAAAGKAGNDGTSAASFGAFSPDGYAPAAGSAGSDGSAGSGGKGGDGAQQTNVSCTQSEEGRYLYDASGPGGGAGGCPGLAGTPGEGGGASVAALVFNSAGLSLITTELVAGNGGNGGKGAFGSVPTVGGAPGLAYNNAGAGTAGGPGGRAGFSGNGAGGPSAALAYTGGDVVVAQDTHTTAGTAGAGVPSRSMVILGATVTIPASVAGPSMPVLKL